MEIKRKLSYSETTDSRDYIFDSIQKKLICISTLKYSLKDAMGVTKWGSEEKARRNLEMVEKVIIHDEFKTFTDLANHYELSIERTSQVFRKLNRVLRGFLKNRIILICKSNGTDLLFDIDEYIEIIANKATVFGYLEEISSVSDAGIITKGHLTI